MSALLSLVFLQPDSVCHEEVGVIRCAVDGIPKTGSFLLGFGASVDVALCFVKKRRGKIIEGGEVHFPEVARPLRWLVRLPVGGEVLGGVVRRGK